MTIRTTSPALAGEDLGRRLEARRASEHLRPHAFCVRCRQRIPKRRKWHARYCSDWCRRRHRFERLDEAADRLAALSGAQAGSPLSQERRAELRAMGWEEIDELLAALDFERRRALLAECALQDCLAEDGRYEAGVRAGVAKALEMMGGMAGIYRRLKRHGDLPGGYHHLAVAEGLRYVASLVEEKCGPSELPPHERVHARTLRLEAALQRIAEWGADSTTLEIAREALEEDAP